MSENTIKDYNNEHYKPIQTIADYRAALKKIEALMMATPDSPEGEELDIMVMLVSAYESQHFPLNQHEPVKVV